MGHPYGTDFVYDEMMVAGTEAAASAIAGAISSIARLGGLKPGDGPSKQEREAGFYDILFIGVTPNGKLVRVSVSGDRDPGYGSTSKMIAESAICLVRDAIDTPGGSGRRARPWTTAHRPAYRQCGFDVSGGEQVKISAPSND